jgi:hypothetical protein
MRGRVTGDAVEGTAHLQDQAETLVTLDPIRRRYGALGRLMFWWEGRRSKGLAESPLVGISIRLDAPGPG